MHIREYEKFNGTNIRQIKNEREKWEIRTRDNVCARVCVTEGIKEKRMFRERESGKPTQDNSHRTEKLHIPQRMDRQAWSCVRIHH